MICPRCKEELPLLSKICPVCGYVAEGDGGEHLSAAQLVERLEQVLYEVKSLPRPTFGRSMGRFALVVVPVLTVLLLAAAWISEAGLFWILAGAFALWSLVLAVKKISGRLGNARADRRFAELKNDCEYLTRLIRRDFGKNREVAAALADVAKEFDGAERARRSADVRNLAVWTVVSLLVCIAAARGVFSVNALVERAADWHTLVDRFDAGSNDEYDNAARLETLRAIVAAREMEEAERFYRRHCMKRVGDAECAAVILRAYAADGDRAAAEAFLRRIELRYASDAAELNRLIE